MLRLRRAGAYVRLLIILLLPFACGLARAGCIESPDPAISRLQALAIADPHKALAGAQAMLGRSKSTLSPEKVAWLHAVRADAYSALELDAEARAAAAAGAKFVPDASAPVRLALFMTDAENVYDAEGMAEAKRAVEAVRERGNIEPSAQRCLMITLGTLQFRENRADLAIATLTQAYRAADAAGDLRQRMLAASPLSKVMGDYEQLDLERQFALDSVKKALATLDDARSRTVYQVMYVTPFVVPNLPQSSTYPQRLFFVGLVFMACLLFWTAGLLFFRSVREHIV